MGLTHVAVTRRDRRGLHRWKRRFYFQAKELDCAGHEVEMFCQTRETNAKESGCDRLEVTLQQATTRRIPYSV